MSVNALEMLCLYTSCFVQNQTIPNTQLGIPQVLAGILSLSILFCLIPLVFTICSRKYEITYCNVKQSSLEVLTAFPGPTQYIWTEVDERVCGLCRQRTDVTKLRLR